MLSDGTSEQAFSQTLTLTRTSKRNRLEQFIAEFADSCSRMTGEQLHTHLDEIEQVHGLYLYRVIYNLGTMNLSISASWFASATLIILARYILSRFRPWSETNQRLISTFTSSPVR